ncbi:hypothetical protein TrST_g2970 [Triparma strigata]|uniref:Uncharacterized protein n=1 Tax=Triparma strigata TaxID=1606541 RepID=A0A9W6ZU73_9STRA|nr:hypothetical protein TrST_g2970 [Triparma strigata]
MKSCYMVCAMFGCTNVGTKICSTCLSVKYCSEKCQKQHWKYHKKVCSPPIQKLSAPVPPQPSIPLKVDEVDDSDKCIICMDRVVNVKFKGCSHSMTCRECTDETIRRGLPCPLCRKPISGYEVGKFIDSIGAHGLWPTSLKNLTQLASGEGFNEYFRGLFVGNEAPYLRWKAVFDVLELVGVGAEGGGESLEQMKKKKADPRKLEVLDACFALGSAYNQVRDEDCRQYFKRAKEGYEEQLGPDSEKALKVTYRLTCVTCSSDGKLIYKLRALVERMMGALGEENVVTLDTLNTLGNRQQDNGEPEEARKVYESCLAGREKVLGEDHKDTLGTVNNSGLVYDDLKDYEKALECYERALKGREKTLGKTHPETLSTVMNIAGVYIKGLKDYGKAEELDQRAFEGYEAQLGKDHGDMKRCAMNLAICFAMTGEKLKLRKIMNEYPHIMVDKPELVELLDKILEKQEHDRQYQLLIAGLEEELGLSDSD